MTRSIGKVDRTRWTMGLTAAGILSLVLMVALHAPPARLSGLVNSGSSVAAAVSPDAAPAGSGAPLDPRIATVVARRPGEVIETIVQFKGGVDAGRARWDVSRASGRVFGELHIINALAVRLTAERARWLAANPDVHSVSLNAEIKTEGGPAHHGFDSFPGHGQRGHGPGRGPNGSPLPQNTYDETLDATGLWRTGLDGAGVGVAVIDTGIDGNLPDFQGAAGGGSRVVETAVTNSGASDAGDSYGHGTDVAGIIAGNGNNLSPSNPLRGRYVGVAPEADLISVKASDEHGNATVLDVIYGLQFVIDHRSDYNIRVVNLSLDSQTPQSYMTDPLDAAVESAWMHGIVVVAAAGNRGNVPNAVGYAPANDPYVITVGAVDEQGQSNPANDAIASWSSQGTTQDGFHKPDVYAPGANIISVLVPASAFATTCPTCTLDGAYIRTSGTSMAAPMISGLVADVLQAHPSWTPDQVKGALLSPAVASNPSLPEVDGLKLAGVTAAAAADGGLTPNQLVDGTTGDIDYSRSSWSRSSWSTATGSLTAAFARSSWSCTCSASIDDPTGSGGGVNSSRSSWSRSSWSTYVTPIPASR